MLDKDYLVTGLNALSRAHERDYFRDGHKGAAVIAAYYLGHENHMAGSAREAITGNMRGELASDDLYAPVPEGTQDTSGPEKIIETLFPGAGGLRQVGHNLIFAAAAVKALMDVPAAATTPRITGICELIRCFDSTQNVDVTENDDIPDFKPGPELVGFIFKEFLASLELCSGFGQGRAGHLLTIGHAIFELERLGYPEVAVRGFYAYKMYIKTIREGPKPDAPPIPDHLPKPWSPLEREYWVNRDPALSGLGHAFKYPYSFYGLLRMLHNDELKNECIAESYQIF